MALAGAMSAGVDRLSSGIASWAVVSSLVPKLCIEPLLSHAFKLAMGVLGGGPCLKRPCQPLGRSTGRCKHFFVSMDRSRRCSRAGRFRFDDRQQMVAVPVCLCGTKALHFDQLPEAARPRLGNGYQRCVGEHAVRGELLVGGLLATPLPQHRHSLIIERCGTAQMPAYLALCSLSKRPPTGPAMQRQC